MINCLQYDKTKRLTKVSDEMVMMDISLIWATEIINGWTRLHFRNSIAIFDVQESIKEIFDMEPPEFVFYVK
jgi:hypothetical protein